MSDKEIEAIRAWCQSGHIDDPGQLDSNDGLKLLAVIDALTERVNLAEWELRNTKRDADRLADEVAVLVRRNVIGSRSPAADALFDYRDPPSSERADRMANLERRLEEVEDLASELDSAYASAVGLLRGMLKDYANRGGKVSPEWAPLETLSGVLSQIDNMYAGIRNNRDESAAGKVLAESRLKDAEKLIQNLMAELAQAKAGWDSVLETMVSNSTGYRDRIHQLERHYYDTLDALKGHYTGYMPGDIIRLKGKLESALLGLDTAKNNNALLNNQYAILLAAFEEREQLLRDFIAAIEDYFSDDDDRGYAYESILGPVIESAKRVINKEG